MTAIGSVVGCCYQLAVMYSKGLVVWMALRGRFASAEEAMLRSTRDEFGQIELKVKAVGFKSPRSLSSRHLKHQRQMQTQSWNVEIQFHMWSGTDESQEMIVDRDKS